MGTAKKIGVRVREAWRASWTGRKAQTTVEYLLVTVALTVAFFLIYRILQVLLATRFKEGGMIILRMYRQNWL